MSNSTLTLLRFVLLLVLGSSVASTSFAQCIGGTTVSTFSGATTTYTCVGDGVDDVIQFKPSSFATAYAFIVTDAEDNILAVVTGNSVNFEGAGEGVCRVWGMSYAGVVNNPVGENIQTAVLTDFCYILSDNFVEVIRDSGDDVDGGMVATPSGATMVYTCPEDNVADIVTFTNTGSPNANYAYVVTDDQNNILGLPPGNSLDFDGAGDGVCRVWGLSYVGNIIAEPGDNAAEVQLAEGCFRLSENFITVIRSKPDGGTVAMPNGNTEREVCAGDGQPDVVMFTHDTESLAQYTYVITDDQNNILGLPPGNSLDFDGAGPGICRVWGLSYTGNITAAVGDNAAMIDLTDDCFDLSDNFITIIRTGVDGGTVAMPSGATMRYTCPGDGEDDIITFTNTSTSDANYAYVITDDENNILGIPPGNSQNFEGAGTGVCRVWGLSYTGNITAQPGDNAAEVALSDECFVLSENFITVIRDTPDGGTVAMPNGNTERETCAGDGEADVVMFTHDTESQANYAYVITDDENNILGLPPGNSLDFEGAGEGICRVWGLSYTGSITAQVGDNAALVDLTDDCFDLSDNFITIIRTGVDGGTVAMPNGETERETCAGDGVDDIVMFTHVTGASANYAYVITDDENNILGIPPGDSQNFEGAGEGICRVWGLSYTGNITAQAGDNAAMVDLTDGCFDLSDNFITIIRTGVDGGTVAMPNGETERETCAGDGVDDIVMFTHDTGSGANYAYVITDDENNILGIPPGDSQNFEGAGEGICRVWGLSYTGNITAQAGDNAAMVALTDGCFDLSDNFITINRIGVDGGTVAMPNGETERETCAGDGIDDIVMFTHDTGSGANYAYVITDDENNILGIPPGDSQNFEGAGEGVCRVWGLSYTGNITAQAGDNAAMVALTDGCFDLSDNFITINRIGVDGGTVAMPNGETERETCAGDGIDDIVMFTHDTGSSANYAYVITDDENNILGIPPGDSQNFEGAGEGICRVWGLSYTGSIIAQAGDNAAMVDLTDGCFDLSDNFITIIRNGVDGGMVAMPNTNTEVTVCAGDGEDDIIMFTNDSESGASYAYVITDDENNILGIPPGNSQNFEGAGSGICRVWGLSYTGNITAQAGDNAAQVALTDGCFALSDNFITVNRLSGDDCPSNLTGNLQGQMVNGSVVPTQVELYPNPVQQTLHIQLEKVHETNAQIEILDISGRILQQINTADQTIEVNVSQYDSGLYLVRLIEAGQVSSYKFLKQ